MRPLLISAFAIFAAISAIVATGIFLAIYRRTANYAESVRSATTAMKSITDQQIRESHRPHFDVEEYIRQWKYLVAQAEYIVEPFRHERRAEVGFVLYMVSAIFASTAAVLAVAR